MCRPRSLRLHWLMRSPTHGATNARPPQTHRRRAEVRMSRRRRFTDAQCRDLAEWFANLRRMGSVAQKAREQGVSEVALRDAIARGQGKDTGATRKKLSEAEIDKLADE